MQTKAMSLVESIVNVTSGMILAYCTTQFILAPLLGIGITFWQNIILTVILTIVSIIRGWAWRRIFNNLER